MPSRSGEGGPRGHERGAVRPGCLLGLLLAALLVYGGTRVLGSEMDYRSLQEAASREARFAETKTDEEIRHDVVEKAEDLELPPAARQVRVDRMADGRVQVSVAYADTIRFFGRWEWVRPRRIDVRGPP